MTRQRISFTQPNNKRLKVQVEKLEYNSKSEVVNDLIWNAYEIEHVREKLIRAEQSDFPTLSSEELLEKLKRKAIENGLL